jgi:hypothetical protein
MYTRMHERVGHANAQKKKKKKNPKKENTKPTRIKIQQIGDCSASALLTHLTFFRQMDGGLASTKHPCQLCVAFSLTENVAKTLDLLLLLLQENLHLLGNAGKTGLHRRVQEIRQRFAQLPVFRKICVEFSSPLEFGADGQNGA